jgi:hypothetical protein
MLDEHKIGVLLLVSYFFIYQNKKSGVMRSSDGVQINQFIDFRMNR